MEIDRGVLCTTEVNLLVVSSNHPACYYRAVAHLKFHDHPEIHDNFMGIHVVDEEH